MSQELHNALHDLDRDAAVRAGDEDLILRAAEAAIARAAESDGRVTRPRSGVHGAARVLQVAAAAILMLSAGASAAWWVATTLRPEPPAQVEDTSTNARRKRTHASPARAVVPVNEVASSIEVLEPRDEPTQPRDPQRRAVPQDAATLFHAASVARGAGDVTRAQRLYQQLIAQHPDSEEAHVAHVALGKLLLSSRRASAAEREFRQYLDAGGGPLSEEALFSRAQALQRLDRVVEERAAWTKLLSTYPQSVYAAHARERLAQR